MGFLPSAKMKEEIIPIRDVDPLVCRDTLMGDVDDNGNCLIRIKRDVNNPDESKLERIRYIGRGQKLSGM